MARDVNHLSGTRLPQRLQPDGGATRARRVDDHCGLLCVEARHQLRQQLLSAPLDEFTIGATTFCRVEHRGLDGLPVHLHADEFLHRAGQFDAEQSHAAIRIHHEARSRVLHPRADGLDQSRQQVKIILKEGIGRHHPVLGGHAQDHFQPAFRGRVREHLPDLRADFRLGDGAFIDIHYEATIGTNEPDVKTLLGLVPLRADHDAVPVAVGRGAGDHRCHQRARETSDALHQIRDLLVL